MLWGYRQEQRPRFNNASQHLQALLGIFKETTVSFPAMFLAARKKKKIFFDKKPSSYVVGDKNGKPNPYQVVFVAKHNQLISTALSRNETGVSTYMWFAVT